MITVIPVTSVTVRWARVRMVRISAYSSIVAVIYSDIFAVVYVDIDIFSAVVNLDILVSRIDVIGPIARIAQRFVRIVLTRIVANISAGAV